MEVIGYLMIAGLFTALFALVAIVLGSVLESALIFLGAGAPPASGVIQRPGLSAFGVLFCLTGRAATTLNTVPTVAGTGTERRVRHRV